MAQLKKGLYASVLSVANSFLAKSVGLISTLVLARVLVPEDFGLVATATIFMGFVGVLTQTGGGDYIVKAETVTDDMLNTSWTINLILKLPIVLITIVFSPAIAQYFGDGRLTNILYFFALSTLIAGLSNPGINLLRREQNILPILANNLVGKIFAVSTAITIALIYESYWALILGQFISQLSKIIGSYVIHKYRPWFSLKNIKHQFNFSIWLVAQAAFGQLRTQFDSFLVASNFTQTQLGQYNVMKYIAFLPNMLVLGPATGPLFRQLASIKNTKNHFDVSLNVSTLIALSISFPIAGIMYIGGTQLVELLLGEQWREYSTLFSLFAFLIPPFVAFHQSIRLLTMFNNTKGIFQFEILSFVLMVVCLYAVGLEDIELFTITRVTLENIFSFSFLCFAMVKYTSFKNFMRLLILSIPVLIFNLLTSYVLFPLTFSDNPFIHLVITTILYFSSICLLFSAYIYLLKQYSPELGIIYKYFISVIQTLLAKKHIEK